MIMIFLLRRQSLLNSLIVHLICLFEAIVPFINRFSQVKNNVRTIWTFNFSDKNHFIFNLIIKFRVIFLFQSLIFLIELDIPLYFFSLRVKWAFKKVLKHTKPIGIVYTCNWHELSKCIDLIFSDLQMHISTLFLVVIKKASTNNI